MCVCVPGGLNDVSLLKTFTPNVSEGKISRKGNVALKTGNPSCLHSGFR